MRLLIEALAGKVGVGGAFFQGGVGGDHFAGNQIFPYAEVLERALGLCAPELVGRNIDLAEAIGFLAKVCHFSSPFDRSDSACGPMQANTYNRRLRRQLWRRLPELLEVGCARCRR